MLKKNIILICTLFLVVLSFTSCGNENTVQQVEPDIATVMATINSQITFPEMVDISFDRVDDYYEIDVDSIEAVELIIAGSGASPEEILVVKFKESSDAQSFKSKMDNRLTQITTLFTNYGSPENADHIQNCKIEVKNQYAFFAICENSDVALQIFNDSFNG